MSEELKNDINEIIKSIGTPDTEALKIAKKKYQYIKYVILNTDFDLVNPANLNNFRNQLKTVRNNLANIRTVINNADGVIQYLPQPVSRRLKKTESLEEIEEIRVVAQNEINALKGEKNELSSKLQEVLNERNSLQEKLTTLSNRIDTEANRLDSLVSTEQNSYNEKKKELESQANSKFQKLETIASDRVSKIESLYNLAAEKSVSGFYERVSKDEGRAADIWRLTAVPFFILIPTIPLLLFWFDGDKSLTLDSIIRKILVGLAFLVPAIYLSRESSKHRALQREAQKTGIRVSSFEPFISSLPDDKAQDLRIKMVEEWFTDKGESQLKKRPVIGFSKKDIVKIVEAIVTKVPAGR